MSMVGYTLIATFGGIISGSLITRWAVNAELRRYTDEARALVEAVNALINMNAASPYRSTPQPPRFTKENGFDGS